MYYKVEAQDDEMYLEAVNLEAAKNHFARVVGGKIPNDLLTWTELEVLPEGVLPLTFEENVESPDGNY